MFINYAATFLAGLVQIRRLKVNTSPSDTFILRVKYEIDRLLTFTRIFGTCGHPVTFDGAVYFGPRRCSKEG